MKRIKTEISKITPAPASVLLLTAALAIPLLLTRMMFNVAGSLGSVFLLFLLLSSFMYLYFKIGISMMYKNLFVGRTFALSALLLLFWLLLVEAAVY